MKALFILLVLLVAGTLAWKHGGREKLDQAWRGDVAGKAKRRVDSVLKGMRDEGGTLGLLLQTSVCQWDRGVYLISDRNDLERALDSFNGWCAEKKMGNRRISGYELLDATCDATGELCFVNVRIEGARYRMRVPSGWRISWAP